MSIELRMPVVTSVPPGLGHVPVATGSVVHRKPSPFLGGLLEYAEYIMRNAGLEEAQAGI